MISLKLIIASAILICQGAYALESNEQRLFTMEKSYHADNILTINALTDENCNFVQTADQYLGFYWLMSGTTKKEIHPLILKNIKEKVTFVSINEKFDSFKVRLNDLNDLKNDLEDILLETSSSIINTECKVKTIIKLGPSANYKKLNLKRTFCEVTTNFFGIPNGCKFLELSGKDDDTGADFKVRFNKK
jgi:hypothetical protein